MASRTLQEILETEYPLLDSSLIAAFISDLPSEADASHESFKGLHQTLTQLSLDALAESDTHTPPEIADLGSHERLGSENSASVSVPDDVSPSASGASSISTGATSAVSCASALDFLHILFPHLSRAIITQALHECCDPQDPDESDLSAAVDHLLTLEYIQDLVERGLETDQVESTDWRTATRRGKRRTDNPRPKLRAQTYALPFVDIHGAQSPKTKSRAHTYTIPFVDIRQRHHAPRIPDPDSTSSSSSSSPSADPWTRLTSLSTRLSELLQPTPPGFFLSYFHAPAMRAPNSQIGWKGEGDGLRNALSVLAARASAPVDKAAVETVCGVILPPEDHEVALLDAEQCARVVTDARLCVTAAQGDPATAIDLVWLLRDLDAAFAQGEGVAHALNEGAVPGYGGRAGVSAWTMTPRHPTITPPTHPPPAPPPPLSQKHPPRAPSPCSDDGWTLVKSRRPAPETPAHPHAEFIPSYSDCNLHTRRPAKSAGNQFGKDGKVNVGERQVRSVAWYKAQAGDFQTKRSEALREASRHWQGGNAKNRGGDVAMYYAQKAQELQEQHKELALGAARAMVEEKRTTNAELDLHGLTVAEACVIVTEALAVTPPTPECPLKVITGRGRHSAGHVSVLGPAVREMLGSAGWRVGVWDGGLVVRGRVR